MNEVIKKLLKDKKNFEKLKKKLSSKDSQAKLQAVCPVSKRSEVYFS